jgi:molybdopterin/thiamine biosynthesis adenylyltransferase
LANQLSDYCLIEDADVAARVAVSSWRRVLNFLADYFPSFEVEDQFERLRETPVVILGAGAVGSWVAAQLAQSGFRYFSIIDDDHVERSNLNRSLYFASDVGKPKTDALANRLLTISDDVITNTRRTMIADMAQLRPILEDLPRQTIVVNCADSPSVDATSSIVDSVCQPLRMPYVIAGGYNLHLSLIGMTVIPGESACYHCSRMSLDEMQAGDLEDLRKLVRPWRNVGNIAPLAAITSSFAANEVIRLAVRSTRLMPRMLNRRGEFNFLTNRLHLVDLPPRTDCGCQAAG